MINEINYEEAKRILADKGPEKHFWLKNGQVLKTLGDLHDAASLMDDATFNHHVTKENNDFSNWVLHVHQDEVLANKLKEVATQREIKKMVKSRMKQLERAIGSEGATVKRKGIKVLKKKPATVTKIKAESTKTVQTKPSATKVVKGVSREIKTVKATQRPQPVKHICPPVYFLKCSSTHFILGAIAGFLLGLFIASMI